jgi:heme/copper-type cytochrome/quinol oxidase subunit 2
MTVNSPQPTPTQAQSRWPLGRIVKFVAIAIIGVMLLIFIIGVLIALIFDAEQTAAKVQIIRDLFIIVLSLQGILIIAALAVLIVQVARLINLLQNEVMPILNNARETLNAAKGTVEFVGTNVADPVIRLGGFLAGMRVLLGEVGGIRRAVRSENGHHEPLKRD